MKQLRQFESWADSITTGYMTEAVATEKKKNSRAMNSGIQSVAQRQYPDLDPQEALITYMGQKLTDMEQKDAEQIKLINRQSQETNKLMNTVQGIRAAYDDLERSSQEVEQEIDQIRGGAERVKSGQEQSTISAREVQELLRTVEELKKNPGVDKREYVELVNSVKGMKDSNVSKEQYDELKQQIEQARADESPELGEIHADIERLKQEYGEKVAGAANIKAELEKELKNIAANTSQDVFKEFGNQLLNDLHDDVVSNVELYVSDKLENLPDEEELAKLKPVPNKVDNIESNLIRYGDTDKDILQYAHQLQAQIDNIYNNLGQIKTNTMPTDSSTRNYLKQLKSNDKLTSRLYKNVLQHPSVVKPDYSAGVVRGFRPSDDSQKNNDYFSNLKFSANFDKSLKSKIDNLARSYSSEYGERIGNLLASNDINGKEKDVSTLKSDQYKAYRILNNYKNGMQNVYTQIKDPNESEEFKDAFHRYMVGVITHLTRSYNIDDSLAQYFHGMPSLTKKEKSSGQSTNLPESYLNAIDTMAENILGEQYGKYLK